MQQYPSRFDWLSIFKQVSEMKDNEETFAKLLLDNTDYCLAKVKDVDTNSRVDYILAPTTTGKYLCELMTYSGRSTHVIGIDCDEKLIYDCMENYVLVLNRRTLDHCCGSLSNGLKLISILGELKCKRQAKKRKMH